MKNINFRKPATRKKREKKKMKYLKNERKM